MMWRTCFEFVVVPQFKVKLFVKRFKCLSQSPIQIKTSILYAMFWWVSQIGDNSARNGPFFAFESAPGSSTFRYIVIPNTDDVFVDLSLMTFRRLRYSPFLSTAFDIWRNGFVHRDKRICNFYSSSRVCCYFLMHKTCNIL